MGRLDGKVALVTGASSGIGRAIAEAFAREGATVALAARTLADVDRAANEIAAAAGIRTLAIAADVSVEADVTRMIETVEHELGPIDVLVNNAGIQGPVAFMQQVSAEDFMRVLTVNVLGTFLCTKAVAPAMIGRRAGRIINLSGGGGGTGVVRGGAPYGTSKGAVEAFTRTTAAELARFDVLCVALQPGRVETRGFPLRAGATEQERANVVAPELGARTAVWLASEAGLDVAGQIVHAIDRGRDQPE